MLKIEVKDLSINVTVFEYIGYDNEYHEVVEECEDWLYDNIDYIDDSNYDDLLDEIYPMVEIGNLRYYPSHVLLKVDPIAYDIGNNEHKNWLLAEALYEIKTNKTGTTCYAGNLAITLYEED